MYVKDEVYYHIHRVNQYTPLWEPGNQIDFTNKNLNPFNAFYSSNYRCLKVNEHLYPPNQLSQLISSESETVSREQLWSFFQFSKQVIEDYALYLRERVFEDVRFQYFPNLPSRRTGIWVFSESAKNYWRTELYGESKVFKVSLTGIIHKADQKHLQAEVLPESILRQRAFCYWTGSDGTNPLEEEFLFEGIVKINEQIVL